MMMMMSLVVFWGKTSSEINLLEIIIIGSFQSKSSLTLKTTLGEISRLCALSSSSSSLSPRGGLSSEFLGEEGGAKSQRSPVGGSGLGATEIVACRR